MFTFHVSVRNKLGLSSASATYLPKQKLESVKLHYTVASLEQRELRWLSLLLF